MTQIDQAKLEARIDAILRTRTAHKPPVALGTVVEPWGTVEAVQFVGERYYWLRCDDGTISMMPADLIERESI